MTNKTKTEGSNRLEELTLELANLLKDTMLTFAKKVSDELKGDYQAGILPYLRSIQDGGFKPDAKVVILPVKQEDNGTQETNTGEGGASEKATTSEESTKTPDTTG